MVTLALAIYCGLRGFTKALAERVDKAEQSIITELSGIKLTIAKIDERAMNIFQLAQAYASRGNIGTIEGSLNNFGKVKVSAQPGVADTSYVIEVEKGRLNVDLISKISKKTALARYEMDKFGREAAIMNFGTNKMRLTVASIDPTICKEYVSFFLKWLDTDYVEGLESLMREFEEGIRF